jgi:hypothetical protein
MQAVLTHLRLVASSPPMSLRFPRALDFVAGRMVLCFEDSPSPGGAPDEDDAAGFMTVM